MIDIAWTPHDLDLLRRWGIWIESQAHVGPQEPPARMMDNRRSQAFITPSGGIPARTGTGVVGDTAGKAECQPIEVDEDDKIQNAGDEMETVYNLSGFAAGGDKIIQAQKDPWGRWLVHFEDCDE